MRTDAAGQGMDRPAPSPEGLLLRLVREAAGIKLATAAKAAGLSKARWSQVETGYESRFGTYRPVTARAGTLAHMAYAIGLSPERLETEGQRPDAARILREILRGNGEPGGAADGPPDGPDDHPPGGASVTGLTEEEAARVRAYLDGLRAASAKRGGTAGRSRQ